MQQNSNVDLRLRDVPPEMMWRLKQLAASKHQTLRAFLLDALDRLSKSGK